MLVAGKFRLTRLLGRGGMGSVWEGIHATLGTRVAVKFIESDHLESPEARNRFENEARAAATLRSKHVVEVYDHGVAPDGRPFIVMEYLEGEPLDRRLERQGRLSPADTARILQQVCRALGKAHAAGIVHRDLKPENIFLVWDDDDGADIAKVVDFGIAKFTDGSLAASAATRTGSVLGTPYYMSPEQARGLRSVDHRADLWSLGVIAFRCLVGRLPFEGEAIGDLLVRLCTAPIPIPSQLAPDVPIGFDAFIARALSREVEHRFQSAQELSESLALVCGVSVRGVHSGDFVHGPSAPTVAALNPLPPIGYGISTGAPFTQTPPPGGASRAGALKWIVAGVAAIAAVALVLAFYPFKPSDTPAPEGAHGSAAAANPVAPAPPEAPPAAPVVDVSPRVEVQEQAPETPPVSPLADAPATRTAEAPQKPRTRPAAARTERPRERPAAAVTTAPAPARPPKKEIDVGY